jgi:NuA3 HAT complex component NTO1
LTFAHDLCDVLRAGIYIEAQETVPSYSTADISPIKSGTLSDLRERKKIAKRILRAVHPFLEAALNAEADIAHKPYESLHKELEGMFESATEKPPEEDSQIIVAPEVVEVPMQESDGAGLGDDNAPASPVEVPAKINGITSSNASVADLDKSGNETLRLPNGASKIAQPIEASFPAGSQAPHPLTPPQSNGSLGRDVADTLNDGGVPWYLHSFSLDGTTAVEEQWRGRDAVRSLSEDLTDMDEEELNGLEFVVEDSTITASPEHGGKQLAPPGSGRKKASQSTPRKGVRSSARKR